MKCKTSSEMYHTRIHEYGISIFSVSQLNYYWYELLTLNILSSVWDHLHEVICRECAVCVCVCVCGGGGGGQGKWETLHACSSCAQYCLYLIYILSMCKILKALSYACFHFSEERVVLGSADAVSWSLAVLTDIASSGSLVEHIFSMSCEVLHC